MFWYNIKCGLHLSNFFIFTLSNSFSYLLCRYNVYWGITVQWCKTYRDIGLSTIGKRAWLNSVSHEWSCARFSTPIRSMRSNCSAWRWKHLSKCGPFFISCVRCRAEIKTIFECQYCINKINLNNILIFYL